MSDVAANEMSDRFSGRSFLVTGGSSGIGLATSVQLARHGARVFRVARRPEALNATREALGAGDHVDQALDAADDKAVAAWVSTLDGVLFSGAAFCAGSHSMRPARSTMSTHITAMYESNVLSVTNFVPHLIKASEEKSSFVLVSSATIYRGAAAVGAYATAKAALVGLTRSLAAELAPRIRVNAVAPGVVATPMTERFFKMLGEKNAQAVLQRHPLGLGTASDVASVIVFLLSDEARWVTGVDLAVDGGYSIHA